MTTTEISAVNSRLVAAFSAFEREQSASPWLKKQRRDALDRARTLGFPTTRHEEWKYTDLAGAAEMEFAPPLAAARHDAVTAGELPLHDLPGHRLVFVNGVCVPHLCDLERLPAGAALTTVAAALSGHSEVLQEHWNRLAGGNSDYFSELNTAFATDGAFLHLSGGVQVEEPIFLVFYATAAVPGFVHPRNLILAGNGCRATVVEVYAARHAGRYGVNVVTETVTGCNSQLEHVVVQNQGAGAVHIANNYLRVARDATATSVALNLGSSLARHNSVAVMGGSNATVTLNGVVLAGGNQHIDSHTTMDHAQPHCTSHEHYAHVVDDEAVAVFNGKIFVRLDAQKTDAKQSNRSLLLSPKATINTKPQLEILADDVKCTHGATIGQLDEEALFYLRSRGVPLAAARKILVRAFAEEILSSVSHDALRDRLQALMLEKMNG